MRIVSIVLVGIIASVMAVDTASAAEPRPWSSFGTYITGEPVVGSPLTCHEGVWTGTPTSYAYTWYRGSTILATEAQYTPVAGDQLDYVGGQTDDIRCRVDATNASGTYPSTEWVSIGRGNGAPRARFIPILRGDFTAGAVLTCTAPEYRNPPTGVTYEFKSPSGGQPASATNSYTVVAGDLAGKVTCVVRATSVHGGDTLKSDTIPATQANDAGSGARLTAISEATLIGDGKVGEPLTCDPGTWPDGTTLTYSWTVGYSPIVNDTDTYTPVAEDQGDKVACTVRGELGGIAGSSYASLNAVIAGTGIDSNSVAPTISGTPSVGSTLTCTTGTWTGEASGYQYAWVRDIDDPPTSGRTTATLSLSGGSALDYYGHVLRCAVRKTNASGTSDWAYSGPVTAAAPAGTPVNTVPPSISGTVANGSTLTCNPGTWTDATTLGYRWQFNGAGTIGSNAPTFELRGLAAGTQVRCLVAASSGERGFTASTPVATVTAPPGAPSPSSGPTITGSGVVGEPLTCAAQSSDPTASTYYSWNVPGFLNAPGTLGYDVYYPTVAQVGRRIRCRADFTNAFGYGNSISADPGVLITAATGGGTTDDGEDPVAPIVVTTPTNETPTGTTPTDPTPADPTPTPPKPAVTRSTNRNDRIRGTARADIINALRGNDWINGGAGNDRIKGGPGKDTIIGGSGRDVLDGGRDNDIIDASSDHASRDRVVCGPGRDRVTANPGDIVARDCERVVRKR